MKFLCALSIVGMFLGAIGDGQALTAEPWTASSRPLQVIVNQLGEANGFGFGRDVCPIGCELPGPPQGSDDPAPFDRPDSPCALTQSWTHDFRADIPEGARIISAALVLNVAGVQADIFTSMLIADTRVLPLSSLEQGSLGSGVVPIPLSLNDLMDGLLQVTVQKGLQTRTSTVCDEQYYDTSALVMVVQLP
jgi:hypothetical protein